MQDEDPRMPHLLAVEQGLVKALTPFFKMRDDPRGDGESSLGDSRPRQYLRKILELAADLGLTAFSSARPNESYWPPTNQRPGADTSANKGLIECFGVRQRFPVPGTEHDSNPVTTKMYYTPRWSDSDEYEGKGPKSEERLVEWWDKARETAKGVFPDEATRAERTRREASLETFREESNYKDRLGWEGNVFF
jgi:hypothetical protein